MSEELTALIALLESGTIYVFWIILFYVLENVLLALIWAPFLAYIGNKIVLALRGVEL